MKRTSQPGARRRGAVSSVAAAIALLLSTSAFGADPEVEALKAELAQQRKLIEQLLQAQQPPTAPIPTAAPPTSPTKSKTRWSVYGVVDVALVSMDSGFGRKTRIDGGGGFSGSRLGFKVERDIGITGLTAFATGEAGVAWDTGQTANGAPTLGVNVNQPSSGGLLGNGPQLFSRQAIAGVSGGFGTVSAGRQYTPSFIAASMGAPRADGLFGLSAGLTVPVGAMPTRVNNSVSYATPKIGPFSAIAVVTAGSENNTNSVVTVGQTSTNSSAGRGWDLGLQYASGPGVLNLTTWSVKNTSWVTAGETGLATKQGVQLSGNYDFKLVKLHASAVHGTIHGGNYENVTKVLSRADAWNIGAIFPFGQHRVMVAYTSLNDKSLLNRDAKLYGVAYWYELTENARMYASYGKMKNNPNASYSLGDSANIVGAVARPGFSPSGFMVGVNYGF